MDTLELMRLERPIRDQHYKRFLEINGLPGRDAWSEAMASVDPALTESEALIWMLNEIINYRYGGISFSAHDDRSRGFRVKFGLNHEFECSNWKTGVAKSYLALLNRKEEDQKIKQISKDAEGKQ